MAPCEQAAFVAGIETARQMARGESSDEVRRQDHDLCVHDQAQSHGCRHDGVGEAVRQGDWLGHRGLPRQLGCFEAALWSGRMSRRLLRLLRPGAGAERATRGAPFGQLARADCAARLGACAQT